MEKKKEKKDNMLLVSSMLTEGKSVWIRVSGTSMFPAIRDGDQVKADPLIQKELKVGKVVCFLSGEKFVAHRIRRITRDGDVVTGGDFYRKEDPIRKENEILGFVTFLRRKDMEKRVKSKSPFMIDILRLMNKIRYRTRDHFISSS